VNELQEHQPSLFDANLGAKLREDAIARVDEHNERWVDDAERQAEVALRGMAGTFTTDELWALLECGAPREPRAMGALMRRLKGRGLVELTGRYRLSKMPACHRRPKAEWAPTAPAAPAPSASSPRAEGSSPSSLPGTPAP